MRPITKSTGRRVPRITGLPARIAGSSTMRAGSVIDFSSARLWPILEWLLRGMCRRIRDAGFLAGHGRARDRKEIPRHAWQRLQNALDHSVKIGQSRAQK